MEILRAQDVEFDVIEYLKAPLDEAGVKRLLAMLEGEPSAGEREGLAPRKQRPGELIRRDKHFKDLSLDAADYTSAAAVASLIAEHPRLMQRPIVTKGDRAVIARPETKVMELLCEG